MIRAWLNCRNHTDYFDYTYSGFYKNAFSYEERRAIATTTVVNESVVNADGGKTSTGVGPNSLRKRGKAARISGNSLSGTLTEMNSRSVMLLCPDMRCCK